MSTFTANADSIKRNWFVINADGKVLGRVATEIATRLKGKHKPEYTPHCDTGDYIVVINAEKIRVTGRKREDKLYYRHTGYPGGLKTISFQKLIDYKPTQVLELAVKGMMPRNSLGRAMLQKLKIYTGEIHPHAAQQPKTLDI
ncbi:MAG: 50S ribosomal protein L13 [Endozoicomonadaceae bacterium]|nr:50S ribosomal protein L13 [Endozoicomonadaceae bacterium]MBE8232517.1 50S ribosomal protein L13 [Endozoicomonadaceae bacterium]